MLWTVVGGHGWEEGNYLIHRAGPIQQVGPIHRVGPLPLTLQTQNHPQMNRSSPRGAVERVGVPTRRED